MASLKGNPSAEKLDVDIRFLLANERTLLAWIRTALALEAGGFALGHVSNVASLGGAAGVAAILVGGLVAIMGYRRFRAADKAIRAHHLPQPGQGPAVEVVLVIIIALALAVLLLIDKI